MEEYEKIKNLISQSLDKIYHEDIFLPLKESDISNNLEGSNLKFSEITDTIQEQLNKTNQINKNFVEFSKQIKNDNKYKLCHLRNNIGKLIYYISIIVPITLFLNKISKKSQKSLACVDELR